MLVLIKKACKLLREHFKLNCYKWLQNISQRVISELISKLNVLTDLLLRLYVKGEDTKSGNRKSD